MQYALIQQLIISCVLYCDPQYGCPRMKYAILSFGTDGLKSLKRRLR